ncbi:hypothetical protein PG985_003853 [Apiospora marii]|uniref:Ubiquitin-like domain-containing protein n=1 Tax=Apiospora marii TaxID=335849 RepID=A0ABR1SIM0_9PEZI
MSFGYAVGDVIAVLGLFERIAIELRNYKDAPAHFQNLSLELDLIRNTLQQVIRQEPENEAERETLEQIRAIILHCQQPLQTWAAKMRSKEASLGHFRSTKSLSSIGTRIHWSMIAKNDIDELRKTILSEMGAIMLLMGVRQMQLKRSVHLLEALPLHLNLELVRLDDALGESWALPFQACQTYYSFLDMLINVVYANDRPGVDHIKASRFAIILTNQGVRLGHHNWTQFIKAGMQIEQSIIVSTTAPVTGSLTDQCPYSDCNGSLSKGDGSQRNICLLCGRWMEALITTGPVVQVGGNLVSSSNIVPSISKRRQPHFGPGLPPIKTAEKTRWQMFRKVEIKILHMEPISTLEEAVDILSKDPRNPTACTFVGFVELKAADENYHRDSSECSAKLGWIKAKQYLQTAVDAGIHF